jgi:hypothetical protein
VIFLDVEHPVLVHPLCFREGAIGVPRKVDLTRTSAMLKTLLICDMLTSLFIVLAAAVVYLRLPPQEQDWVRFAIRRLLGR